MNPAHCSVVNRAEKRPIAGGLRNSGEWRCASNGKAVADDVYFCEPLFTFEEFERRINRRVRK